MTSDDYRKAFGLREELKADGEKAFTLPLEIRKFEIDLYWKRGPWAIITPTSNVPVLFELLETGTT